MDYRVSRDYWEKRREQQRQQNEDAYWEEQDRLKLLRAKFKPACPSCGHRHKGATGQSEELLKLWCRAS